MSGTSLFKEDIPVNGLGEMLRTLELPMFEQIHIGNLPHLRIYIGHFTNVRIL